MSLILLSILVSALSPNPSFVLFWETFIQLGGLLGQGLRLGPGLDNIIIYLAQTGAQEMQNNNIFGSDRSSRNEN